MSSKLSLHVFSEEFAPLSPRVCLIVEIVVNCVGCEYMCEVTNTECNSSACLSEMRCENREDGACVA